MARTDTKEEYGSNVLANKISESAEKEAQEAFEQIQKPFKDISFEVPAEALVDVQIKESSEYSEDKFYHITKSLGIHGVWIGADDSTPEITVNFNNYSVKVLDDFDGSSTKQITVGAFFDNREGKPNLINIINAKDFSIKRNIGTIIFALGSGTERGIVNVRTTESIFLDTEKNNTTSLILNIGGSINLASKNIALKAGDGGIIDSTQEALTNIEAESLFIEREGGSPYSTATIRAVSGGNIEIRAKDLYVKSIRSYLLQSGQENSKIDIKVDNAYFEGHINPNNKGEINIEGAKVFLNGDIFSQWGLVYINSDKGASRTLINGHIYSFENSTVNINFGEGGLLQGASFVESNSDSNFVFGKGSVWLIDAPDPPENYSAVTNLSLQEAFVDFTGNTATPYISLIADNFEAKSAVALMDVSIGQENLNDKIIVNKTASGDLGIHIPSTGIGESSNGAEDSGILVEVSKGQDLSVSLISPTALKGDVPVIDLGNYLYQLKTEDQEDKTVTFLTPYLEYVPVDPAPGPDIPPSDPAPSPVYSPTAEAVLAMAGMGAQSAFYQNQLTDVRKRLGEIRSGVRDGLWTSVAGQKDRLTGFTGTNFKQDVYRFNFGLDTVVGDWILGGNFKFLNADQKTRDTNFKAKGDAHSEGLNLYATWQNEKGCYADFILSADRYHQKISNTMLDGTGVKGTYRNLGWGVSAEIGKKFSLNEAQTWFAEPQLQLSYYHVKGDDFTMTNGMKVEQGNFNSLTGRIGVAAGHEVRDSEGKPKGQVYLRTGLKHEFLGKQTLHVNGEKFRDKLVGTRAYYGLATDWNLTKNLKVFGHVERENGSHYTKEIEVMAGVKYTF